MGWKIAVAPFLISQCYNTFIIEEQPEAAVAPFLISQCYNGTSGIRLTI